MTSPRLDPPQPITRFSAERAAFAGLRLVRREPRLFLALSLLSLIFSVVVGGLAVVVMGPSLAQFQALGARPDPAAVAPLMARIAPFQFLTVLLSLAYYAAAISAVDRAVLRPEDRGAAGLRLRLGPDEWRQVLLMLILTVGFLVVYFILVFGLIIVAVLLGVGATLMGIDRSVAAVGLGALAIVGMACAMVVVMVRLSLASPLAFAARNLDLPAAWRLTRGRFWPLLGAFALTGLMMAVLGLAFLVAEAALILALGGGVEGLRALFSPDLSSVAAYFAPLRLAFLLLGSLVGGVFTVAVVGAQADAYAQIAGMAGADPAPDPAARSTHFGVR